MNSKSAKYKDWTQIVNESDKELLQKLPFSRLERIPPPKRGGLPFGHELRICARFLIKGSSSLDPSALTTAYLSLFKAHERLLFHSLILRKPMMRSQWNKILGTKTSDWIERGLLVKDDDQWCCLFAIVPVEGLILAVDPQEGKYEGKIHIGQDSLALLQFIANRNTGPKNRILDVGTGSGILMMAQSESANEAVGVDINPRAVRAARFNATLNQRKQCEINEIDVFSLKEDMGLFDFVIWNVPFMFFPDSEQKENLDGFGGHLGIDITLQFIERLPELLHSNGKAIMLTAAPILKNKENRLLIKLKTCCQNSGLDIVAHTLQSFWVPRLRSFHESHGIDRFESVVLEIQRGTGQIDYRDISPLQRASDMVRGLLTRLC